MRRYLAILTLLLSGHLLVLAGSSPLGKIKDFALSDLQGRKHTAEAWKDKRAVVLVFLGTECPVSNGYAPELRRLVTAYAPKGVLFYGIHPDPDVSKDVAVKHAADFRLPFVVLLDPAQTVARQAGVRVVPEAVVLAPQGQVLYRGAIDDLYTSDGKRREEAKTRYLDVTLSAVLAGKAPALTQTKAFGCPLPEPIQPADSRKAPP